jgi:GT2 family glycosyltransferase
MPASSVAVIIITRNRLESLKQCLACLAGQTRPADELIVVDSSTDFVTRDFVRESFPSALYIHAATPLGSLPTKRNIALSHVHSEVVAVTDDDGFPQPAWLAALLECHGPGVGAVGGRILQGAADDGGGVRRPVVGALSAIRGSWGNFNVVWHEPFEVEHLQGTNMSFRRDLLTRIGGWDATLECGYAAYEDTDVCLRIRRLGTRVIYNPNAVGGRLRAGLR